MSREQITKIVTFDTKEEFIFDDKTTHRGLYEIEITITPLRPNGTVHHMMYSSSIVGHVTEKTLLNAGYTKNISKEKQIEKPEETMEELALRLMEKVGIFPQD